MFHQRKINFLSFLEYLKCIYLFSSFCNYSKRALHCSKQGIITQPDYPGSKIVNGLGIWYFHKQGDTRSANCGPANTVKLYLRTEGSRASSGRAVKPLASVGDSITLLTKTPATAHIPIYFRASFLFSCYLSTNDFFSLLYVTLKSFLISDLIKYHLPSTKCFCQNG